MHECRKRLNDVLGMNVSTANSRLVKDLLFQFVEQAGHVCFRCGEAMTRETFSIEHTTPWLGSDNPVETYFDLSKIAYSHRNCNSKAGSKGRVRQFTEEENVQRKRDARRRWQTPERRRDKYLRNGT